MVEIWYPKGGGKGTAGSADRHAKRAVQLGKRTLRKNAFRHVGTDRATVTNDLCQQGRRRRRRGGGVRCSGTSTASETQAGTARRTQAPRESRKKGWLSACGWSISRPGRAAVRRGEGSAERRGRSGDVGCAARRGRSGRGCSRRGWRSIRRRGQSAVRRGEGSPERRGRSGDAGCAARGGRSGRGCRRRGRGCIS